MLKRSVCATFGVLSIHNQLANSCLLLHLLVQPINMYFMEIKDKWSRYIYDPAPNHSAARHTSQVYYMY